MKLTFEQIKEITTGAVQIVKNEQGICFHRCTKEQEEAYKTVREDFYEKALSSAGVKFVFQTDSVNLGMEFITSPICNRTYFSVDIFVDGKMVDCVDNFSSVEYPPNYTTHPFPLGDVSKRISLKPGIKTVCIHLPWSVETVLKTICIDDGAFVKGVQPEKKLLAFGDSFTQGYDALHPSKRYIAQIANKLNAEEFNKAVGGARFTPEVAAIKDDFNPDYIFVAYGTNEWNCESEDFLKIKCEKFFSNLYGHYPKSKIFVVTPIWRKDFQEDRIFGKFEKVEEDIREIVKDIRNVTVISGFDLVPENENLYGDFRLHPNDEGFEYYYKALYEKMRKEF